MKVLKILFIVCVILGSTLPASSQEKGNRVVRPMKGSFYAIDVPPYGNPQLLAISGQGTHLGNFAGTMIFSKPPTYLPHVEGTLVSSNGDEIYFQGNPILGIVGMNPFPYGTLSGKIIFDGGSGRFNGCTGEITITGVFDMNANCASWTADGWIKY